MLNMTVGEFIAAFVAVVAGLVGLMKGLQYLFKEIGKAASKWLEKGLEPVNKKLSSIEQKVDQNELENDKTTIVMLLADIKTGEALTEIEMERLHETYERYTELGGNSYIHNEWERLRKEGKL